eukprot:TRINITY_DN6247_c0_g1_i1.p1 TRINITY_DN6247_c0_g1~~TRINITY_DN6247_c0_g1_i1.p1  ORF type:complete len:442 (+),score=86.46 TRINITY_DN6247_c0_g1_i1:220-1545(+)
MSLSVSAAGGGIMRDESRLAVLRAWREEIAHSYETADAWRVAILTGQLEADDYSREKMRLIDDFDRHCAALAGPQSAALRRRIAATSEPPEFLNQWLRSGKWDAGDAIARAVLAEEARRERRRQRLDTRRAERTRTMERLTAPKARPTKPDASDAAAAAVAAFRPPPGTGEGAGHADDDAQAFVLSKTKGKPIEELEAWIKRKGKPVKVPPLEGMQKRPFERLSKAEEEAVVERFYKTTVETREKKLEKLRRDALKGTGPKQTKKLTSEELSAVIEKHYLSAPLLLKKNREVLTKKVVKETAPMYRVGDGSGKLLCRVPPREGKVPLRRFLERVDQQVERQRVHRDVLAVRAERHREETMGIQMRPVIAPEDLADSVAHLFEGVGGRGDVVQYIPSPTRAADRLPSGNGRRDASPSPGRGTVHAPPDTGGRPPQGNPVGVA